MRVTELLIVVVLARSPKVSGRSKISKHVDLTGFRVICRVRSEPPVLQDTPQERWHDSLESPGLRKAASYGGVRQP